MRLPDLRFWRRKSKFDTILERLDRIDNRLSYMDGAISSAHAKVKEMDHTLYIQLKFLNEIWDKAWNRK